ncbi:CHAT domain-containing protein [Roseateles sp. NT4]|uniref:CHAT domain-containing protein n=1 Tax=Roseateles sp. NT4 TaxID=3453715 RepID=UPI003EEAF370
MITATAKAAETPQQRMRAAAELGLTLAQERRFGEARAALTLAYGLAEGESRAAYALELGTLAAREHDDAAAARYLTEAAQTGDARVRLAAALNLARTRPDAERLPALRALSAAVMAQGDAALLVSLGHQARALGATELAWRSLEQARHAAAAGSRAQLDALDGLAGLYESQGRFTEALSLDRTGLAALVGQPVGGTGEMAIEFEWRNARLYKAQGQGDAALAAYQRAADRLEALRADIPIELEDGSSSYSRWFEPIYLGLTESLLDASDGLPPERAGALLRRARDAMELLRQTEMQDFLGDRCAVDAVKGGSATVIPAGTVVIHAVLLPQRLELLVESAQGFRRVSQPFTREDMRGQASRFAAELRNQGAGFLTLSQRLYDRLLRPLQATLEELHADTLVLVPDSALRMVPFGALHDGRRFAIEQYALGDVAGLSMTNTTAPHTQLNSNLLAGVADFGPVVDKLMLTRTGRELAAQTDGTPRSVQASLALPGVNREILTLEKLLPGERLLNSAFTVDAFSRAARSGRYRIIHVASHGVFGGDAHSSFMLAYDDLITLDSLQLLLGAESLRRQPLELLTLSACETAEGNERAPLGISGAAIRARAKSVLGTLWPVDDDAAVELMQRFYGGLAEGRTSKAQALRQAQRELLAKPQFAHPFFWAPFTLIGNWL